MSKVIQFPSLNRQDRSSQIVFSQQLISYLQNTPIDPERLLEILENTIVDSEVLSFMDQKVHLYQQGELLDELEIRQYLYQNLGAIFSDVLYQYYDDEYLIGIVELARDDSGSIFVDFDREQISSIRKLYVSDIERLLGSGSASAGYLAGVQRQLAEELGKVA